MKIPSLLNRLKSIKKHLKGTRLIVALALVTVLLVSTVSVAAYTMNLQKEKQHPVAEKVQSKPTTPVHKVELKSSAVTEEKPAVSDSTQPAPAHTNKPAANQTTKPRPHTSEDPAFVTCTQKYSELYVKYNADNASINAEKSLALATIDELYNSGFYAEIYPGDTEPYNHWQIDRAELVADYSNQLTDLYNTYEANSAVYLNC
ncbi:MAG: hypothetical protein WAZ21_00470 [Candidatus Saccharimonadales bacterium]